MRLLKNGIFSLDCQFFTNPMFIVYSISEHGAQAAPASTTTAENLSVVTSMRTEIKLNKMAGNRSTMATQTVIIFMCSVYLEKPSELKHCATK